MPLQKVDMNALAKALEEVDLLAMDFASIAGPSTKRSVRTQDNLDRQHCWEIKGLGGTTLDMCATLEQAEKYCGGRQYWEIWEITAECKKMVNQAPTPTFSGVVHHVAT